MHDIATLSQDVFRPLIGETVILENDDLRIEAKVEDVVERLCATPRGAKRTAFSVFLTAPEPCDFIGGTFFLSHASLDRLGPVYISRIVSHSLDAQGAHLEVGFN